MKLDDPRTIRLLWIAGLSILAVILLIDLFVNHHAHFPRDGITIDTLPDFFPVYGFLASFALVILAKTMAIVLKRKDTFYDDE